MTTTTSYSNKNRFGSYLKGLLKRNSGYIIFLTAVEFLFFPVQLALYLFSPQFEQRIAYGSATTFEAAMFHTPVSIVMIFGITVLASIVIGLSQFSYMNSKRSVDVYHSLPITRNSLFLANFLAAFITVIFPLAVNQLIAVGIATAKSISTPAFAFSQLSGITDLLCWFVVVFAILACIAFAQVQVGRSFDAFIFSMELIFAPLALVFLTLMLFDTFIYGFNFERSFEVTNLLYLSPIAAIFGRYVSSSGSGSVNPLFVSNMAILVWLAIGILLVIGSMYLYNRRKSEIAESAVTTGPLVQLGKLAAVYVGGMLLGIITTSLFGSPTNNPWSFVIWSVIGAVIVYVLAEFILLRGFKGLSKDLAIGGVSVALVGIFAAAIVTGGFGYETHVHKTEDVKSVTISYRGRYSEIIEWDASTARENKYSQDKMSALKTEYSYNTLDTVTLTSPEAIKIVTDFHKAAVEKHKEQRYNEQSSVSYAYLNNSISYDLGNKELKRYYSQVSSDLLPTIASLEDTAEFKKLTHPIFRLDPEQFTSFTVKNDLVAEDTTVKDDVKIKQLVAALRADMLNENITGSINNNSKIALNISFALKKDPMTEKLTENYFSDCFVIINDQYTKTIKLLNEMGYGDYVKEQPSKFTSAYVLEGQYFGRGGSSAISMMPFGLMEEDMQNYVDKFSSDGVNHEITDAVTINELWSISKIQAYNYNRSMTVIFLTEDGSSVARFVYFEELPEKIKELFPYLVEQYQETRAQPVL